MTGSTYDFAVPLNKQSYHEHVCRLLPSFLRRLIRTLWTYLFFNLFFACLTATEVLFFLSFSTFFDASKLLAYILAAIFLTFFSFLVLRLYIQVKKPEQLLNHCEEYLSQCKELIHYQEGVAEHHIALASAAFRLASNLAEKEYTLFTIPLLQSITPLLEKFSSWIHWKDFHRMRECLLMIAVEQHIKVIKCAPTNLEVHAALANAYVRLSAIYADPKKQEGIDEERWIPKERTSQEMKEKFIKTAERAIEEFKILNDYAPHDPWVHMQLAYSYHDLQMPLEEIREYEIILSLRPNDHDVIFKLGVLYFEQGMTAKGLRIYEALKRLHPQKAENLIKFYDMQNVS